MEVSFFFFLPFVFGLKEVFFLNDGYFLSAVKYTAKAGDSGGYL